MNPMKSLERNQQLSIFKAISITLMVVGHAGIIGLRWDWVFPFHFIYLFHMSAFFWVSGYFFAEQDLDHKVAFTLKRVRRLYLPMVSYGLVFLVLHNFLVGMDLLNVSHGFEDARGTYITRANLWDEVDTILRMYPGEAMLGGFWFLRVLFFSSLIFLVVFYIARLISRRHRYLILTILVSLMASYAFHLQAKGAYEVFGLNLIRELSVMPIYMLGLMYRRYGTGLRLNAPLALVAFGGLCYLSLDYYVGVGEGYFGPAWVFYLSACLGVYLLLYLSKLALRLPRLLVRPLCYLGDHTLDVLAWHFVAFKAYSLIRLLYWGDDMARLGEFPVLRPEHGLHWLGYTFTGVTLPLLGMFLWRRATTKSKPQTSP